MGFLKKYIKKYGFVCIISILCVITEAICDLFQPKIMSRLIDNGVQNLDLNYVVKSGMLMLGITGLGAIFAITRNVLSSNASQSFGADLRYDLFVKIQNLSVTDSEKFDAGSLVTRMTNDVTQITNFFNGLMRIFFKAPVMCFGSIFMAFTLNINTVPIILASLIIVLYIIYLCMKLSYPQFIKIQGAIDKLNTNIREYLIGIRLIRAFGRFEQEEERFNKANNGLSDYTVKANRILSFLSPGTSLMLHLSITAVIFLGASWVMKGSMKVGQIIAFVTYITQILMSLNMIINILSAFVRTKASYLRIAEVMNINTYKDSSSNNEINFNNIELCFKNASFAYPDSSEEKALKDINLEIRKGQTLGIIGPTGSGKSTLASLLLRFYDTSEGMITLNGLDIRTVPAYSVRNHIAIVPQKPTLFSGTVKETMMWGKNDASLTEIENALKYAQIYDFVSSSKDGLNMVLGQSGVNLSGGQKQRLSIARALCKNPDILILDDCTSALDAVTEAKIMNALRNYSKDIIVIMISQRISSVKSADKILVLDNGNMVGLGTHKELINSCQVYKEIYLSQIGGIDNVG